MKYSFKWSKNKTRIEKRLKTVKKFQWRYRNLILLAFSIIFAGHIITSESVSAILLELGSLGYFSSFVIGFLFSYGLTTIPAAATLYLLGRNLNALAISVIATTGAVISDYFIFNFIRKGLLKDMRHISERLNIDVSMRREVMRHKDLMKMVPVMAGLIAASPIPKEFATVLFATVNFERKRFLQYSIVLNFVIILLITSVGKVL